MKLVAFVTIIFGFSVSPQIGATCTKHYGTKISNNIEMDSCPKDYYGNLPIQSNNFQINLEMDSYEMSNRLQIEQYQLESFTPYKHFQFLSGAYALEPEHDTSCNEKPIYIYIPIEKDSLKHAIDWNEGLTVPDSSNISDDDRCFISPTTPKLKESSMDASDQFRTISLPETNTSAPTTSSSTTESSTTESSTTKSSTTKSSTTKSSRTESSTKESSTTESTTTTLTTIEPDDLSLCDVTSEEGTNTGSDKIYKNENVPEKSNTTTDNLHPDSELNKSDVNDEVLKKPSIQQSDETIATDDSHIDNNLNNGLAKVISTPPSSGSSEDCEMDSESNETSKNSDDNNEANKKQVQLFHDKSEHLFDIVASPEVVNWDETDIRKYKIDKNGNLVDILNNNKIKINFDDNNNLEDSKRKIPSSYRRDLNGNIINIVLDGNLDKFLLNLVDDVNDKKKKVYLIDKQNNLVDIQNLQNSIRVPIDSDESIIQRPPSKFYTDKLGNRIELIQTDIFFLSDYSWSSEDIGMDKPKRKYRIDKNGNLVDIITGEDAGVNWEFIDENKLKPILDIRGNIIIVVLNEESFDNNDLVKSKKRRICRLDRNLILIGFYLPSVNPIPNKQKNKHPTVKPPRQDSDDYSISGEMRQLKEKKITEETYPDMFKDTICLGSYINPRSDEYSESESEYSDDFENATVNNLKPKIPSEMFVDTNCLSAE